MRLIIVSGRSGSGKSTALNVLEDNGFYCIDNLPAGLLPELAERALIHTELAQPLVAVSIDARNLPSHLSRFPELLEEVRAKHIHCDVLYLDADEETLLKRFSETRRRHPLSSANRSLAEAIEDETKLLGPIIDLADLKINTTNLNLYQLRDAIKLRLLNQPEPGTAFLVESFGFKRGMPVDADLVFDVRCLPNPYWKPELRDQSGLDQPVVDYLAAQPDVEEMFQDISSYLLKWLPRFAASNRAYVTIAIGCTGGHHRSVYLTERLDRCCNKPSRTSRFATATLAERNTTAMPAREIEIINKLGLHARASAKFVGVAGQFPCQIRAGRTPESMVDGKSIMAMMMLAAGKGTKIHLKTEGEQEQEAMDALVALINNYFDEGE